MRWLAGCWELSHLHTVPLSCTCSSSVSLSSRATSALVPILHNPCNISCRVYICFTLHATHSSLNNAKWNILRWQRLCGGMCAHFLLVLRLVTGWSGIHGISMSTHTHTLTLRTADSACTLRSSKFSPQLPSLWRATEDCDPTQQNTSCPLPGNAIWRTAKTKIIIIIKEEEGGK